MRGFAMTILIAGLLACGGCFTSGPKDAPVTQPPVINRTPPVSADQINLQNARTECQKLEAEIGFDEQLLQAGMLPN